MELNVNTLEWNRKLIRGSENSKIDLSNFEGLYNVSINEVGEELVGMGTDSEHLMEGLLIHPESLLVTCIPAFKEFFREMSEHTDQKIVLSKCVTLHNRIYILWNLAPPNLNCVAVFDPVLGRVFPIYGENGTSTFRLKYTASPWQHYIIVFGGLDGEGQPLNTIEIFDITTYRWGTIKTSGKRPSRRHSHSTVVVNDIMYVLGGTVENNLLDPAPLEDLYKLDLTNNVWTPLKTSGISPSNLVGHSLLPFDDDKLLCIWDSRPYVRVSILFTEVFEWRDVQLESAYKPLFRLGNAALYNKGKLFVFGGFSKLNYNTLVLDYLDFTKN